MRSRGALILAVVALASLATSPARALDTTCSIGGGSVESPHVLDPRGDSLTEHSGSEELAGHDPTDLLRGWFARDAHGKVTANIQVSMLTGAENSVRYYFKWEFRGDNLAKRIRWVMAQPRAYGHLFRYGYYDTTADPLPTYVTEGTTTGTVTPGTPGHVSINVPLEQMGKTKPGDSFRELLLSSRAHTGSPGAPSGVWPPSPAPSEPGGFVSRIEDSWNGTACETITV